ncbi:MAG TPA: alpha/beta hydrolase [Anaerolineaceae bacterium]|nr:alpha/beta hydrolase [Anaerolineaceae bacterium]
MDTKFLDVADGRIAYDDMGKGPLVLCVPSMGDLRAEYRFLAPHLAAAGFRVISIDVRGHGESSVDWPDYSVAGVGCDMLDLIRSLNNGPAVIIGESMAGGAAVWAAAKAPELVAGLLLLDPFVRGGGEWWSKLLYGAMFARPWGPAIWLRYYASLYPSQKPADFAQYSAALGANLKEAGRMEALLAMLAASKKASEDLLPAVSAPTLVLMGAKDRDFKYPEQEASFVAQSLRGTYQMISEAGHYPHAELPEVTVPIALDFVCKVHSLKERVHVA